MVMIIIAKDELTMATKQGMCTNCGSLVIFDDRDEVCECIFCHCVFPSAEALALLENSEGHEFKNETFEKKEGSKNYYSCPVFPDKVSKAVERDKVSKSRSGDDLKLKPSEFEVSPNDVKAPMKLIVTLSAAALLIVGIVVAVSLPIYFNRVNLKTEMTADIAQVFEGNAEVNTDSNEDGYIYGYNIFGMTCQNIKVQTADEVTDKQASDMFEAYCALRSEKGGYKSSNSVKMEIYTPTSIYTVTADGIENADA